MPEWRPVTEFFNASSMQEAGPLSSPPIPAPAPRGFVKDPTGQTRFLVGLLWAYLGVCAVGALITAVALATGHAVNMDPDNLSAYDIAGLIAGLLQLPVVLTTGIVFLMWIYRANRNARGLGAEGMTFTPGWSVGWFFIPIANLWKPFQAMKEIWQASADPAAWRSQKPPSLLSTWWALWIFSNLLANLSFGMLLRSDTSSELLVGEVVTLISGLMDIPLCLVAMRMVRQLIRLQSQWAAQPVQTACVVCRQPMAPAEMIFLNQTWVCARCKPVVIQQLQEGVNGV